MKKLLLWAVAATFSLGVLAQNTPVTTSNYELPARFTPDKMKQMVYSTSINPHFLKNDKEFWYTYKTPNGTNWYIVNMNTGAKSLLFDNVSMAAQISEIMHDPYNAQHLPIGELVFSPSGDSFIFEVLSTVDMNKEERADYEEYRQVRETEDTANMKPDSPMKKRVYLEYNRATGKVSQLADYKKPHRNPSWASVSPDGNTVLFARDFNLYYMDKANFEKAIKNEKDSTIIEHQITTDGTRDFAWGGTRYSYASSDKPEHANARRGVWAIWAPDGKHFLVGRTDNTKVKELWVINNVAKPRPVLETYKYHMAGEPDAPQQSLYLFDTATKSPKNVDISAFKDQTYGVYTAKRLHKDASDLNPKPTTWLGDDNNTFYLQRTSRDLKKIDICKVNIKADSLKATPLVEERMNTSMETRPIELINNGRDMITWSQRTGWAHLYIYDVNGNLKQAVTNGDFHVERVVGVDQRARKIYFIANGVNKEENPYYTHLYSVSFDGSGMKQLTTSNFDHRVTLSDDARYFVDNYSRVDTAPVSELKSATGSTTAKLETADLSRLFEAGYKFPEIFTVKAADGVTDLYGVMYKPFDFDSTKVYPVIEYVYPGPQTEAVNSSFSTGMDRTDRLAQFGFIVVTVGNRGGSPMRSKWYHNYGYGNLRDYGLADKVVTINQLANRHSYIDRDRVGITGHSGGGFMSTAAILQYPEVFKVAVSCAGNHENNIYNRWWSEKHHGVKEVISEKNDTTFQYSIAKNSEVARNLKGKLLLVTGDIDDNVHPAGTMTVVDALIRAGKRFDMLILPGQRHGFGDMTEYYFWRMGDYFSQHLIGDVAKEVTIPQMASPTK